MLGAAWADMAVVLGIQNAIPRVCRLWHLEAFGFGVADTAEIVDFIEPVAPNLAGCSLNNGVKFTAQKILDNFIIHDRSLQTF